MDAVAAIIELSVAPVFLLAGIGALLTVLSNRLGRITDRARVLLMFLREVGIATRRMQIGLEFTVGELDDRPE
ncbi:MAG TPA: DUF2721 domain-containing protein [Woeseiaceae bacterium]|nr:DUF2721 domain-containing protein [Woeseiaceae bacterium]